MQWKLIIGGVAALAVSLFIWLGYQHYQSLIDDKQALAEKAQALYIALNYQAAATEAAMANAVAWARATKELERQIDDLARITELANAQGDRINEFFRKHDLQKLINRKPGLLERRINRATAKRFRVLKQLTDLSRYKAAGSEITP